MSTQHGTTTRTRAQKYKNRTAFKNDLHDKTPKIKMINSLHVCEVCERCKSVIEWKIKYKKYKPLSQAKTCARCQQRNIKKAYHIICRDCSFKDKVCAKCLKSADEVKVEPSEPSDQEQVKLNVEMDKLIKSLPERKKRSFLRYMKKGKHKNDKDEAMNVDESTGQDEKDKINKDSKRSHRIPHSRDDLMKRIELLKIEESDDDDEIFSEDNDSFDDYDDDSSGE